MMKKITLAILALLVAATASAQITPPFAQVRFFKTDDGSATVPAWSFTLNPNSGFYRIGTNNIGLATNGVKRVDWNTARMLLASGYNIQIGANTLTTSDLLDATKMTGILPGANGGSGNGFFAVSGPASTLKTFTLPNASSTILTDNAAVTRAQGGTGQSTSPDDNLLVGDGSAWQLKTLTDCQGTGKAVTYTASSNTFGCNTISGTSAQTTTSTGTQNDFATGITFVAGQVSLLRANNATLLTITGIASGVDGAFLRICSVGAGQVDLTHQAAGSTATNRLINFATVGNTSLAAGIGCALFGYDGTTTRWRLVEHDQGAPIVPAYAGGNFTAASGTWTVDSGDVQAFSYFLRNRVLTVSFWLNTTSTSSTPSALRIGNGAWGSYTIARDASGSAIGNANTASLAYEAADWNALASDSTFFQMVRANFGGTSWEAQTNAVAVRGVAIFEVN